MLLSNKALLAKLWARYPNHQFIACLFYAFELQRFIDGVKKPLLSRESAMFFYYEKNNGVELQRKGSGALNVLW